MFIMGYGAAGDMTAILDFSKQNWNFSKKSIKKYGNMTLCDRMCHSAAFEAFPVLFSPTITKNGKNLAILEESGVTLCYL